jgi:hypothetical protein
MSETTGPQLDGAPIPPDLIGLKAEAIAANIRAAELIAAGPSGADVAAGRAAISGEQAAQVSALREQERRAAEAILAHPWKAALEPSKWIKAREVIAAAARAQLASDQPAS